jgi:hypothetical protein
MRKRSISEEHDGEDLKRRSRRGTGRVIANLSEISVQKERF